MRCQTGSVLDCRYRTKAFVLGMLALRHIIMPMQEYVASCDAAQVALPPAFRAQLRDAQAQLASVHAQSPRAVWQELERIVRSHAV